VKIGNLSIMQHMKEGYSDYDIMYAIKNGRTQVLHYMVIKNHYRVYSCINDHLHIHIWLLSHGMSVNPEMANSNLILLANLHYFTSDTIPNHFIETGKHIDNIPLKQFMKNNRYIKERNSYLYISLDSEINVSAVIWEFIHTYEEHKNIIANIILRIYFCAHGECAQFCEYCGKN
jgi:hypothetical protein